MQYKWTSGLFRQLRFYALTLSVTGMQLRLV